MGYTDAEMYEMLKSGKALAGAVSEPIESWICDAGTYRPGDPRPAGYLAFHEWAEVQGRAGLRQTRCRGCGLWLFPQEREGHRCKNVATNQTEP